MAADEHGSEIDAEGTEQESAEALACEINEIVAKHGRLVGSALDHDTHLAEIAAVIEADRAEARRKAALETLARVREIVLDKMIDLFAEMESDLMEDESK